MTPHSASIILLDHATSLGCYGPSSSVRPRTDLDPIGGHSFRGALYHGMCGRDVIYMDIASLVNTTNALKYVVQSRPDQPE